jgi:hypothetical protein
LLQALADGAEVRLHAAAVAADSRFVALPWLAAVWRPKVTFSRASHWIRVIMPEHQRPIREALASMPVPSLLVDGGHEVAAYWLLDRPIRDEREAGRALARLAEKLGAEAPPASVADLEIPLAGRARNWNPDSSITLVSVDLTRRYGVADLVEGVANGVAA